ncbi:Coenzyme F420 hydrogenase/dehydrogenase, beta subunit C-terminal domain [Flavisphingomonas formosensis]|uniref:Coenzyme F420 hydrogenase/dehydrogenase, beta subunit C-terminal domain n=1 Tax=Flavisphingomonas formosensis TaxID=861534 RepID=UPI0012F728F2|nr:Coenzyme F420 hydrogenase/dehydrogenase, beta subunit C-terminal domain [Sphingomonas formosensis]
MRDVNDIKAAGLCAGCGLCAGVGDAAQPAIVMRDTSQGYRRPFVQAPVPPAQKALVDAVCPGVNIQHVDSEIDAPYHPSWGPIVEARLGWSTDMGLRRQASSGGGLSSVLLHLLDSGQIDYVVQTAVSDDSPLRNALRISTGRDDIFVAAGSRYAPSSPLEDIAARLDAPGRFAFVGKPCDVAGLRALARRDPRVAEKVPYMLAFMCAGVPSYRGTDAVLKAMGIDDPDAVVSFRYRGDGWPGFATAVLPDGTSHQMDYNSSWGGILNRHLQFRCKICPDGTGEFADITFADGWLCDDKGYPLFEEQDGRSLVLTRTRKGEALLQEALAKGFIDVQAVPLESIRHMQPFQTKRKGFVQPRMAAMASVGLPLPRFRNLRLSEVRRSLGAKEAFRNYLGTLRRLVRKRRQD